MNFFFSLVLMISLPILSSCSIYKSDGRKALEANGPPYFANKAAAAATAVQAKIIQASALSAYLNSHPEKTLSAFCQIENVGDSRCLETFNCIEVVEQEIAIIEKTIAYSNVDQNLLLAKSPEALPLEKTLVCASTRL